MKTHVIKWLVALGLMLISLAPRGAFAQAEAPPLAMAPLVLPDEFLGHISALRDPGGQLTLSEARAAPDWVPIARRSVDFGYTTETIWLRVGLRNTAQAEAWRLRLRENFFQEFAAWLERGSGAPELLIRQDTTTGFASRPEQWPELVVPFTLAPGAEAALWLRYRSGGSSEVEMLLYDAAGFAAWSDRRTARDFVFYGILLCLILTGLVVWVATRRGIFAVYAAYAASGLLFVMHGDGNTFRYLWPDAPGFNAFASIPLGGAIIVTGALFARQFLQTALYHPVFDALLRADIALGLGLVAASAVTDTQTIKKVLVLSAFLSLVLFTLAGLNAARTRFREVRFYVLAWSGAVVSSAIMTGRHWLGIEMSEEVQFGSMRVVLVTDAALMGLAILDRLTQMRQSRAAAMEVSLANAQRNLALSRRLSELEARYELAEERAASRARQVADVIHDLRQPLHALRLDVRRMIAEEGAASVSEVESAFAYLERLVEEELRAPPDRETAAEMVEMTEVFSALSQMFAAEADAKGLELRLVLGRAALDLPPLAVMRMAANLVGNAVRYTERGRVLVGMRRRPGGALRIEVHDTGPGLDGAAFAAACARHVRLDAATGTEGSGLGLAIVAQAAAEHGLELALLAERATGTSIGVTIPVERVVKMG